MEGPSEREKEGKQLAGVNENTGPKSKLLRCVDWLQKQNELEPKKLSLQNQNDIQFIIECNAQRKNFFLSVPEEDVTVPAGVDEPNVEPLKVPLRRLRVDNLRMLCEWLDCQCYFTDYELFQKHVNDHTPERVTEEDSKSVEYACQWDICGHKATDYKEMTRHMSYHAYHAKLLAIGFNGRATLNLERCKKDSSKRNTLPPLKVDHCCMWTGCTARFNSIQAFFEHVKRHVYMSEGNLCSWGGCGARFPRRVLLTMHARRHSGERLIACYHCGRHFACNRKLSDHLARQNVNPDLGHLCRVCGQHYATAHLLREHTRQHVSAAACALCDMSAPSVHALAHHVRYRHVDERNYKCTQCTYRAVSNWDLKLHMTTHNRKRATDDDADSYVGPSDEENSDGELKRKKKVQRKYACHMCQGKELRVFRRGNHLTKHLVKVHGAQWPYGYSRFRYQISDDGFYRLTTTRFEFEEISRKIVDGYSGPKGSLTDDDLKFDVQQVAAATDTTPARFEVVLRAGGDAAGEEGRRGGAGQGEGTVEITMCDVDEEGNIISSQVFNSGVYYT